MSQNKIESLEKAFIRILHWGIFIDIFLPVVIFFLAIYLRDNFLSVQSLKNIELLFYVLIIISLGEILVIFIFRKRFWETFTQKKLQANSPLTMEQNLFRFGMIIYALCLSFTLYGLIYYLLGGTWERFALFVAITFLSFQLFKPRGGEIEKLIRDLKMEGQSF